MVTLPAVVWDACTMYPHCWLARPMQETSVGFNLPESRGNAVSHITRGTSDVLQCPPQRAKCYSTGYMHTHTHPHTHIHTYTHTQNCMHTYIYAYMYCTHMYICLIKYFKENLQCLINYQQVYTCTREFLFIKKCIYSYI